MAVGSTDRRNTLCELLRWRLILQGLARPRASAMRRWADLHLAETERRQCAGSVDKVEILGRQFFRANSELSIIGTGFAATRHQ